MKDAIARRCGVYYSFFKNIHTSSERMTNINKYKQMTFCLRAIYFYCKQGSYGEILLSCGTGQVSLRAQMAALF